jgi:phosphatidylglycerol lysyltransferase
MAHLTLLPDKCYFFTEGGSMAAYAVYGRVALALGDPIGPPDDSAGAIDAFREYCVRNDWLPAFCLTSAELLATYRRAWFGALCLGHEGVIDLASFTLRGNARKTLRKRYNRLTALGYRIQICEPPIQTETLAELRQISDEWLGLARAAEKRFFLAWFDEDLVRAERLALVRAPDGAICAFVSLTPEYQLNELSIDLMRRRRGIESGVMDFLFVSLILWARRQGYETFNLGLSPLFGVGSPPGEHAGQRSGWFSLENLIHFAYQHGNFYDFKGLNGFKLKFHPTWAPQYMIYPGLLAMPWVGLAMARANAGEHETLWQYFSRRPPPPHLEEHEDTFETPPADAVAD